MDTIKFEQFIKICEVGNMTRAAEELYVSQPALSQSVSQLESFLGHKLFDRVNRKLVLNGKGRLAYKYLKNVSENIARLKEELDVIDGKEQIVKISSDNMNLLYYINSFFFIESKNAVLKKVEFEDDFAENMLLENKADVVLSSQKCIDPSLCSLLLFENCQYVLTPSVSPMYGRTSASLNDFVGCEFVRGLEHDDKISSKLLDNFLIKYKPSLGNIHYLDKKLTNRLKLRSAYHSFITSFVFYDNRQLIDQNHSIVKLNDESLKVYYYVSYKKEHGAAVEHFVNWLKNSYPELFDVRRSDVVMR